MENALPACKGRPREFCTQQALAAALRVFWSKGYEGASMADLTEAMGITKPSLYAAFGNKESLFHKALDLYEAEKLAYIRDSLDQPTARGVAEHLLRGALKAMTSQTEPKGCLGVIHSVACGSEAESIKAEVVARRASVQTAITARFQRAVDEGDLRPDVDPEALANLLYAVLQGMAVQAGSGVPSDQLDALVDSALALWPSR
ncbi:MULTISPECIES: TetR/AcrR family transcriptional regulator [Sphingomonas]|jgi:AcrR family transcriptional regulator|uniref:TetR/AcrR family transcriptional regulator n=2 Tax=Pseudomonadota TaxID=1224 RepID=A0A7Y6EHG3_9SPHN|nr:MULTISPECIES: TetR/AcrR family transcriptional regulator [Sphingomonas]MDK8185454.1 TetR/AcrR family transcriptional regulator [Sphingomonas zeae]MDK8216900.1 TetR/AcrR family transcriptional regulator [Sphingomonas sp. UMB7805-LC452B]NUU47495.1 TetR/AcrR family transcriptional regulator [Sphingomonas zeae]